LPTDFTASGVPQGIGAESLRHLVFHMLIQQIGKVPIRGLATFPPIPDEKAVTRSGPRPCTVFNDHDTKITRLRRDGAQFRTAWQTKSRSSQLTRPSRSQGSFQRGGSGKEVAMADAWRV
jgi:hypothetical protein